MKRIIKERGQGKTSELIRISADKQIPILTTTNTCYIIKRAEEMGVKNLPNPLMLRDLNLIPYKNSNAPILVDEVDIVLQTLLRRPIYASTITCPKRVTKSEIADMFGVALEELEIVD